MTMVCTALVQKQIEGVTVAQKAVETVELSLRVAGQQFKQPKSTVHHVDRPTALPEEEKSTLRLW